MDLPAVTNVTVALSLPYRHPNELAVSDMRHSIEWTRERLNMWRTARLMIEHVQNGFMDRSREGKCGRPRPIDFRTI